MTIRNYVVAGDRVLISSNGAINLYIGNNERSDGHSARIPELRELTGRQSWSWFAYGDIVHGVEEQIGRPLKYSEVSSYFMRKALRYMHDHPVHCLQLAATRALMFWGPIEVSNNKEVRFERRDSAILAHLPGFPFALASALLGLILLGVEARRGRTVEPRTRAEPAPGRFETLVLIVVFVAVYSGSFLPFLVAERFRVPVVPFLFIFGGYGVGRLGQWAVARDVRRVVVWTLAGMALYGFAQIRWSSYRPEKALWHMGRGEALGRIGESERAIAEYRAALELLPSFVKGHRALASLLDKHGRDEEALREYRILLDLTPGEPDVHYESGRILAGMGRLPEAEAAYQRTLELDPEFVRAYVNLGELLIRQGRTAQAIEQYRRAIRIDETNSDAHYNLANAFLKQGAFDNAITEYRAVLRLDPDNPKAHVNLGNALAQSGDVDSAIAEFRRALVIDPQTTEALFNLAAMLSSQGQTAESIATLERLLRIDPANAAARQALQRLRRSQPAAP